MPSIIKAADFLPGDLVLEEYYGQQLFVISVDVSSHYIVVVTALIGSTIEERRMGKNWTRQVIRG